MMKRYAPLMLLSLALVALLGISSCNSKKNAADAAAKQQQEKFDQADRDKARFERALPQQAPAATE
ncbi:MAG: hypothetical protein ACK417_07935 [Bacteroidia bacterium]